MKLNKILDSIEHISYSGDSGISIEEIKPIEKVGVNDKALSWCNDRNLERLEGIKTSAVIVVSENASESIRNSLNVIVVPNPRRTFQEIMTKFFSKKRLATVSGTAYIHESVRLGKGVFIGENVVIEENCTIGEEVTILHNTVIFHGTVIGNNVTIGANNTVGGTGFGYEKNKDGDFELIPHLGNVIIEDNVDIGNNSCIDRAVMGSTILEENVKVDNLVHIAHGVRVGRNAVVIANAMVAGSVEVGENSWIAPSASIMNKKKIGKNSLVGLGAVVTKEIEDNVIVAGNPARILKKINQKN